MSIETGDERADKAEGPGLRPRGKREEMFIIKNSNGDTHYDILSKKKQV